MENRKIVTNYLRKLLKERKIDSWGYDKWQYWNCVPFIEVQGQKVFLAKSFYYARQLCIKTIFDYKSRTGMKNFINNCIENQKILTKF